MTADRSHERMLIVAPVGRDADLMCTYLERAGLVCRVFADMQEVCDEFSKGAAALIFTDEALVPEQMLKLSELLNAQPPWSEVPIIILTGLPSLEAKARSFRELGRRTNITLIDRPVRIPSLVSAAQSALKARHRQYEVRDLMQKLEDRVHERDRFLAILGHELRNPLSAILLGSQMIGSDGRLDGEHAQVIERQSRHLTRLVNDLLDLSRVVSGKIVLKKQLIDLRQIVRQCTQTLRDSGQGQHLRIELRDCDGPLMVYADPVRAEQIVSNILTNAVKYTPDGGHVVVTIDRDARDNAVIRVSDDGVGVAPERIGSIFELFAQAENAIGRSQGGMGIGLALVRNLVELHGGTVSATSEGLGKGSEFVVRLPIAKEVEKGAEVAEPVPAAEHTGRPRSIVIVEDNADVRDLLRLKLRKLGHEVEAAADGPEGVQVIVRKRPDLALIDLGLPGFDGYEVAQRVRRQLDTGIILVAVSGFGQPEDKRKALEAGFDEHLTKPADVRDIEDVLNRFPPRNRSAAGSVVR